MKQLLTLMIFLGSWLCVGAQTTQSTPSRLEKLDNQGISHHPQSPSNYHIYCLVEDGNVIVYSMEPLCGEVIANDTLSGEILCDVVTDLGGSYSFYVGSPRTVELYVIVDGLTYYCEIDVKKSI